MNVNRVFIPITIQVPQKAVEPILTLVNLLFNSMNNNEEDTCIESKPLADEIRPGKLLRAARLRADLTQKELALKIGVPQTHISQYEKNKRKIPMQKAKQLANILNTSEKYFLN